MQNLHDEAVTLRKEGEDEQNTKLAGEKLTLVRGEEEKEVRGHGKDTRMWGPKPRAGA